MADLVRMSDGFQGFVDRMTEGGERVAEEAVERTLSATLDNGLGGWPVASGRSAGAFSVTVNGLVGELVNSSGYALAINRGESWRDLFLLPFRSAVDRLPGEVEGALSEID